MLSLCLLLTVASRSQPLQSQPIRTSTELIQRATECQEGDVLRLAAGTFLLSSTLELKSGVKLGGAGAEKTILKAAPSWRGPEAELPPPDMTLEGQNQGAYLIRLKRDAANIEISGLTLQAPQLHGAIFGWYNAGFVLDRVAIRGAMYSGLRSFGMSKAKITNCTFVDAGGRWESGKPGVRGGNTGGGIFACWISDSEIANNMFKRTRTAPEAEFYGIKVREARRCSVHHNTIATNFSMEFPFENDADNDLSYNVCHGAISIPKYAGGAVPASGRTFRIHHNVFFDTYSIEFVRNGVEIDHNLFDFKPDRDHGNLISAFGDAPAPGPLAFHNNLIRNPGRGVIWMNEPFNNLTFRNNHVICRKTATPRTDGLFGFHPSTDFATVTIRDNIIECPDFPRPLLRSPESYASKVENNRLVGISDKAKLSNQSATRKVGLEKPLKFRCGVDGGWVVDGWKITPPTKSRR